MLKGKHHVKINNKRKQDFALESKYNFLTHSLNDLNKVLKTLQDQITIMK